MTHDLKEWFRDREEWKQEHDMSHAKNNSTMTVTPHICKLVLHANSIDLQLSVLIRLWQHLGQDGRKWVMIQGIINIPNSR